MIVDIERSGLARPADSTDKVRIAPGNIYGFIQKRELESDYSYLLRVCLIIDQEQFQQNLIKMFEMSSKFAAKQSSKQSRGFQPGIPILKTNPAVLYTLSHVLSEDSRYLTTGLCG